MPTFGTHGLVTVKRNGRVVLKFVASDKGFNAPQFAEAIRTLGRVPALAEGYDLALRSHFGSTNTLVATDGRTVDFRGEGRLRENYRERFAVAEFNPKFPNGEASFTVIVEL